MKNFIRAARTFKKHSSGCEIIKLTLCRMGEDWQELDSVECISGVSTRQKFRQGREAEPGSLEPIPEGYYFLGSPEWKDGAGNWNASWGNGLGPVWTKITKTDKFQTERDDFGIHFDANMDTSPGSAGCLVFQDKNQLRKLVSWWDPIEKPYLLTVNWELGSVETSDKAITQKPKVKVPPPAPVPVPVPVPKPVPAPPVPNPNPVPNPVDVSSKGKFIVYVVAAVAVALAIGVAYLAMKH